MKRIKVSASWTIYLYRGVLFLFIWWFLTGGVASSWWIGVPAVILAVTASRALLPPAPVLWFELLKFVPFFLWQSLLGGADVARRVFQPKMPIAPDLIEYPLRLPHGLSQVIMSNTVSLLPGTLITELDRNVLKVHVLNRNKDSFAELEAVEERIAGMSGLSLSAPRGGDKSAAI